MSEIILLKCDNCKKMAKSDNHYQEAWIEVEGQISVGTGKYNKKRGSYDSQWIDARNKKHFCSWSCLMGYNTSKL